MKTIKKFEIRSRMVRVAESKVPYGLSIQSPQQVTKAARSILNGEEQEVFLTFLLDIKNRILGYQEVARGALDSCPVDPRVVFRTAIMMGASSIIVAHCHPSGDPEPSREDRTLTKRVIEAGTLLGIRVLDHVIVGHGGTISMAEKGWM